MSKRVRQSSYLYTEAHSRQDGAVSISYDAAGRTFGRVVFDTRANVIEATRFRRTPSGGISGAGACDQGQLPAGVLKAAIACYQSATRS